MAKRANRMFDLIWVHMDATHSSYNGAINAMRAQHEALDDFKLSVNLKKDGLEALVKVAGVVPGWVQGKPWAAAVIRIFDDSDHDEAGVLVNNILWEDDSTRERMGNS